MGPEALIVIRGFVVQTPTFQRLHGLCVGIMLCRVYA